MKKGIEYKKVETIFSYASTLQQSGKLRNTVYCLKNRIYILNQDHTVLLRFLLHGGNYFEHPVCFEANDYDSPVFEMKEDQICFITKRDGYERRKSCKLPQQHPIKIAKLFKVFSDQKIEKNRVTLNSSFLSHLEEGLSHVEFKGTKQGFEVLQRNIYSGTIISIKEGKGKLFTSTKNLKFRTVGLRTNDFIALFTFADNINLYFSNKDFVWIMSDGIKKTKEGGIRMPFTGIISQCIYDQLGKV